MGFYREYTFRREIEAAQQNYNHYKALAEKAERERRYTECLVYTLRASDYRKRLENFCR